MISKLEWDTNFFGINIAKMECKSMSEKQFHYDINTLKEENVKLIYCVCHDKESEEFASKIGKLVDIKVTYCKTFSNKVLPTDSNTIEEYLDEEPTEELYNLAIQSGIYSRFNIDQNLPNYKFIELYRTWIRNSTRKQIASKVLVAKEKNHLVGMITLGEKEGRADIGLLAVDSNYRGRGIGKSLVFSAENEFQKRFNEGQVVTQKDNTPACTLYEKCGYTIEKIESIYHIWLEI